MSRRLVPMIKINPFISVEAKEAIDKVCEEEKLISFNEGLRLVIQRGLNAGTEQKRLTDSETSSDDVSSGMD